MNFQAREQRRQAEEILAAVRRNGGNRAAAARELGMQRTTLTTRIRRLERDGAMQDAIASHTSDREFVDAVLHSEDPRPVQALKALREYLEVSAGYSCSQVFAQTAKRIVDEALKDVAA